MRIYCILVTFLFALLISRSVFSEDVPKELLSLFMTSPDLLNPQELDLFKEWYDDVKVDTHLTLPTFNEEWDRNRLSLYAAPKSFLAKNDQSLASVCFGTLFAFYRNLELSETINAQNPFEEDVFENIDRIAELLDILSFYKSFQKERVEKNSEEKKIKLIYAWFLPSKDLLPSNEILGSLKILRWELKKVYYPGIHWKSSYLGSYSDLAMFEEPLSYKESRFELVLNVASEELCMRQSPLHLELDLFYTYQSKYDSNILTWKDSKTISLNALNIFDISFRNEMKKHFLEKVKEASSSYEREVLLHICLHMKFHSKSLCESLLL